MSIEGLKEQIDSGLYPIIHPQKNLSECLLCCPIDKEYLTQCTHYLIFTHYFDKSFICRIITSTDKYGNIKVKDELIETL